MANISPEFLEEGKEMAACPVCRMVLHQPTSCCPEGHAVCRGCYVAELAKKKQCPVCKVGTDETKLQRCGPLDGFIGQLKMRCTNGRKGGEGGGQGGAAPPCKKVKLEKGLDTGGEKVEMRDDAGEEGTQWCSWRGRLCELAGHLVESCAYEPVRCPNADCKEWAVRKDSARHTSDTCAFREVKCVHCPKIFQAWGLDEHERSCPEAKIECPNAGCGETVPRGGMAAHRSVCVREEVECPCPGCEERMTRADVGRHEEASQAVHLERAWQRAEEMEGKLAEQGRKLAQVPDVAEGKEEDAALIAKLKQDIFELKEKVKVTANLKAKVEELQRHRDALTRVFNITIPSTRAIRKTPLHTFADGVVGFCESKKGAQKDEHYIFFTLQEGPAVTLHFKCWLLHKNDSYTRRLLSKPDKGDFSKKPVKVTPAGTKGASEGAKFKMTAEDKRDAEREDGSIKVRMAVHLYVPE